MAMKYLTPVEYEVIKCIDNYIKENGISPTYREKGYISIIDDSYRSIKVMSGYSII